MSPLFQCIRCRCNGRSSLVRASRTVYQEINRNSSLFRVLWLWLDNAMQLESIRCTFSRCFCPPRNTTRFSRGTDKSNSNGRKHTCKQQRNYNYKFIETRGGENTGSSINLLKFIGWRDNELGRTTRHDQCLLLCYVCTGKLHSRFKTAPSQYYY